MNLATFSLQARSDCTWFLEESRQKMLKPQRPFSRDRHNSTHTAVHLRRASKENQKKKEHVAT